MEETVDLIKAIGKVSFECPAFTRDTDGQTGNQKYKYTPLENILTVLKPICQKHGLVVVQLPVVSEENHHTGVITRVYHEGGMLHNTIFHPAELGGRDAIKDQGGVITYLRRYALVSIFGLVLVGEDWGGDGSPATKPKQKASASPKNQAPPSEDTPQYRKFWDEVAEVVASSNGAWPDVRSAMLYAQERVTDNKGPGFLKQRATKEELSVALKFISESSGQKEEGSL